MWQILFTHFSTWRKCVCVCIFEKLQNTGTIFPNQSVIYMFRRILVETRAFKHPELTLHASNAMQQNCVRK